MNLGQELAEDRRGQPRFLSDPSYLDGVQTLSSRSRVNTNGCAADVEIQSSVPVALPSYCACCTAPVAEDFTTSLGQIRNRTIEPRKQLSVPYCQRCIAHIKAGNERNLTIAVTSIPVSLPMPFVLACIWPYAPAAVIIMAGFAIAIGLLVLLNFAIEKPRIERAQGCCTSHAAIALWRLTPMSVRLRVYNPWYADQLARMYNAWMVPAKNRAPLSLHWITVPILALFAGLLTYFATHATVHFDNPSTVPLTFVIDGGARNVTVGPGRQDRLVLPIGIRDVSVLINNQPIDRFTGKVEAFVNHVATPFSTMCYARLAMAYGMERLNVADREPMQAGKRWYTLSNVDYVLEPFPKTIRVNSRQPGARRVSFARVDCSTGEPVDLK